MISVDHGRNRTMHIPSAGKRIFGCLLAVSAAVLLTLLTGCSEKPKSSENASASPAAAADAGLESVEASAAPTHALTLPMNLNRWTGDFDGMAKRQVIRALVINSKTGFFYDKGRARGVTVEILEEFETFVNKKLRNPNPRVRGNHKSHQKPRREYQGIIEKSQPERKRALATKMANTP